MAYSARANSMFSGSSAAPSLRQPSSHNAQQSSALASRIASKKSELDSLKQLRDMSSALAMQMQALEDKLGTLKDGTEGLLRCWITSLLSLTSYHSYCLCPCQLA
ncbi:DASH complex subunit dad2, variant 2 [Aspergillus melleus]|uniref:DASH complex subunit dad2, variant 2 n=1 Tax=Aspergillus melleus TaxID=138277 RepID=UPI001E8E876F|nr:DASH complex subunit dad2, variant 2 [Aspergillus melleus]KAH8428886.1 DASH complex subunit dad2, variant 2 [Aspergillus melleus]